jgi:hypothetical protein
MINQWANTILDFIFGLVNTLYGKVYTVINLSEVNKALMAVNVLATSFIVVMMMKQILTIHILEIDGDADQDPIHIVEKGCIALAILQMQNYLLVQLLAFADAISEYIMSKANVEFTNIVDVGYISDQALTLDPIIMIIILIAYIIGFGMFLWKSIKRSAEIALMKIVFPIFVCDMVTVSMERFRAFFNAYIVLIFGYIVQMLLFKMSILMIVRVNDLWMALAFIMLAAKAPQWLEKYTYSSGAARSSANAARSAATMLPQIMRAIK